MSDSKPLEDKSLSRITQEEMKELMLYACQKVEDILLMKEYDPEKYDLFIKANNVIYCSQWER